MLDPYSLEVRAYVISTELAVLLRNKDIVGKGFLSHSLINIQYTLQTVFGVELTLKEILFIMDDLEPFRDNNLKWHTDETIARLTAQVRNTNNVISDTIRDARLKRILSKLPFSEKVLLALKDVTLDSELYKQFTITRNNLTGKIVDKYDISKLHLRLNAKAT